MPTLGDPRGHPLSLAALRDRRSEAVVPIPAMAWGMMGADNDIWQNKRGGEERHRTLVVFVGLQGRATGGLARTVCNASG